MVWAITPNIAAWKHRRYALVILVGGQQSLGLNLSGLCGQQTKCTPRVLAKIDLAGQSPSLLARI